MNAPLAMKLLLEDGAEIRALEMSHAEEEPERRKAG